MSDAGRVEVGIDAAERGKVDRAGSGYHAGQGLEARKKIAEKAGLVPVGRILFAKYDGGDQELVRAEPQLHFALSQEAAHQEPGAGEQK